MPKYKLTTLTPIHISSGEEYELNYNLLQKDGFVYLYDEFKLVEYFIAHNIAVPSNINELKNLISKNSDKIIASGLHSRKIESSFSNLNKPLLENITTAQNPIITGSSIKGSLRTAILDCLYNETEHCCKIISLMKNKKLSEDRLSKNNRVPFDNDFANIFKYLKVTDSLLPLKTKVYKTINMKKDKSHQGSRENKVEEIANYVEAIEPNQAFEIELNDIHEDEIFKNLAWMSNKFYIPFFTNDEKYYFSKKTDATKRVKEADKGVFIINIGRFGGAESKTLNNLRYIKTSRAVDKSTTSAKTFALEQSTNEKTYFENQLLPFGWVMCEKLENNDEKLKQKRVSIKQEFLEQREQKFMAIDKLNSIKNETINLANELAKKKKQQEAQEKKKQEEEKAKKEAKIAAMSPFEKFLETLKSKNMPFDTALLDTIKNDEVPKEMRCEAIKYLKQTLLKNKKWKEVTKAKKPEKDKDYQRTLQVVEFLKECN